MSHPHHPTLLHNRLPYFGRTGLVRNGLVAEYRFDESKNLLKYSQQFDNAEWTKTRCSITPNATTAPDGTSTADKLIEDGTASNTHQTYHTNIIASSPNVFSVHVKAAERSHVWLVSYNVTDGTDGVGFDLSAGTVGSASGQATGKIQSLGDGWYRCIINCTYTLGTTTYFNIRSAIGASAIGDSSYSGDGTSGIYIWGAQLEPGSVARTYYPTTDKQLLMDYSRPRKNLLLPNQANACEDGTTTGFADAGWGNTYTASTTQKWQGSYSLKSVILAGSTNEGPFTGGYYTAIKPNTQYTASLYVYSESGDLSMRIRVWEYTDAQVYITVSTSNPSTVGAAWTRLTITFTSGATSRKCNIGALLVSNDDEETFYVDGLQLEEGSTATAWEAPPNIGYCGSTTGSDTNDPTWTGEGLSHGADDYVTIGGVYNAAGTLQNGYGLSIAFYTAEVTAATSKLCLVSLGANKGVYLGAVGEGLTDETITVQYSATSFTYATGTIAAGWHILDLVWNGAQYEIWLDGVQRTGTDVDTPALLSLSAVKMRYDGTTYGSGLTGAYSLKYNRAPTLAERNQNKAYLKSYLLRERGISLA